MRKNRSVSNCNASNKPSPFDKTSSQFGFCPLKTGEIDAQQILATQLTCRNLSSYKLTEGIHTLQKSCLVYYGAKISDSPKSALDLTNSRIKFSSDGLVLSRDGTSFELTFNNKKSAAEWYNALKGICISTNFNEQYEMIKMIEKGRFSSVYLLKSKQFGNHYAAKVYEKSLLNSTVENLDIKAAMLSEIEILRSLNHESIIKLNQVFETEKSIYLVSDLIRGASLDDILKNPNSSSELSENQICYIIYQILKTLAYMSSKKIMHRDVKASNIFLEEGGKIKIIDFGLAANFSTSNYPFKRCGTPGYIAPEIFNFNVTIPSSYYNDKCDVFAAACILFYLFFKKPLFEGGNVFKTLENNRNGFDQKIIQTIKAEISSSKSQLNKEGLKLLLLLLEPDFRKRISAKEAHKHPYFDSLNDTFLLSPKSPNTAEPISPTSECLSPTAFTKSKFFKYKSPSTASLTPEHRNSKFTFHASTLLFGFDSLLNADYVLISAFCNKKILSCEKSRDSSKSPRNSKNSRSPSPTQRNPQSFLKAAIFCNIKNQSKALSLDENSNLLQLQPTKRSSSDAIIPQKTWTSNSATISSLNSSYEVEESDDICDEGSNIFTDYEVFKNKSPRKQSSKAVFNSPDDAVLSF